LKEKYMRKYQIALLCAATASVTLPSIAEAADPFSGFRLEAVGGLDRAQADHHKNDGFLYGGAAGYDVAAGRVRFGPELEVTGSTEKACDDTPIGRDCMQPGRDIFVGGRVGVVATPKLLVYGKAGYTNAWITDRIDAGPADRFSISDDRSGYRVGAGVEYAMSRRLFVKTEYRYSHYTGNMSRNQIVGGLGFRF
jgi:outer membrane immunogenic protein